MVENIWAALKIMGQGMLGIFVAIFIIMVIMIAIQSFSSVLKKKEENPEKNKN